MCLVTLGDFCYGWSLWAFLAWLRSYSSDAGGVALDRIALMTMFPLLGGGVGDTPAYRDSRPGGIVMSCRPNNRASTE